MCQFIIWLCDNRKLFTNKLQDSFQDGKTFLEFQDGNSEMLFCDLCVIARKLANSLWPPKTNLLARLFFGGLGDTLVNDWKERAKT